MPVLPAAQATTAPPEPSVTITGGRLFASAFRGVLPHWLTPDAFSRWARQPLLPRWTMIAPPAPSERSAGSVSLFMLVVVTGTPCDPHWTAPAALTFWA